MVNSPGDNVLAEFASVVDAVRCAVDIEHALKDENAALPELRQMPFRIGINRGDVRHRETTLRRSGERRGAAGSLADPGGSAFPGTAYDQVKNKPAPNYEQHGRADGQEHCRADTSVSCGLDFSFFLNSPSPTLNQHQARGPDIRREAITGACVPALCTCWS